MHETKVIAISGASGCGKTTIVKELAAQFKCPYLQFDAYVDEFSYPQDMRKWYEDGANVSEIKTPRMIESLRNLTTGEHKYIFIEEPFGRERSCISALINHVVLLDLPMELCLSRLTRRNIGNSSPIYPDSIIKYLEKYEDYFRDIYIETVNQVRKNCDLIIHETCPVSVTTDIVSKWLKSKKTNKLLVAL